MSRLPIVVVVALATLLGCTADPGKPPVRTTSRASASPAATAATPTAPKPSAATPGAVSPTAVTPSAAPVAAAPAPLQRPAAASNVLRGRVALDAAYMLEHVGGRIAQVDGAASLVIGAQGEAAVTAGGTIIASNGAGIVSSNGGGIISSNGGGIVSSNGGGIVSSNGGGLMDNNGGSYHLAATEAAPAVGTTLPAVGMVVSARSLRTGQVLALGQDADGKPVYEVISGPGGAFEVYVPKEESGNVLIDARPPTEPAPAATPGASPTPPPATDRKLVYEAVASAAGSAENAVDEDTTLVVAYMRHTSAMRTYNILTAPDLANEVARAREALRLPVEAEKLLAIPMEALRAVGDEVGVAKAPPAATYALAVRLAEQTLARLDLDAIIITKDTAPLWADRPPAPAIPTMVAALRRLREGAAVRLAANPQYFADRPYLIGANACKAPGDRYVIERPSDVADLMVREFVAGLGRLDVAGHLLGDVIPASKGFDPLFDSALTTVSGAILGLVVDLEGEVASANFALVRAFTPAQPVPPGPAGEAIPASPCPIPSGLLQPTPSPSPSPAASSSPNPSAAPSPGASP